MTTLPRSNQESIKEKISAVREVIPTKSNHEITLVLQYYEYNVSDAIAAFMEDGAADALKAWNHTGNKPAKKKNKKKSTNKQTPGSSDNNHDSKALEGEANHVHDGLSYIEEDSVSGIDVSFGLPNTFENGTVYDSLTSEVPDDKSDNSSVRTESSEKQRSHFAHSNHKTSTAKLSRNSSNSNSRQNSLSLSDDLCMAKNSRGKKSLEKSIKELGRHTMSFQRCGNLLNEEIEKSQKRLQQSFQEMHRALDQREKELAKALNNVKQQATDLLRSRQEQAAKLKIGIDRGDGKTDAELNELRIDIKHFVSERKFDDDLCRTVRFVRDHDRLLREIKLYGEIVPVKNSYTQRRQSASSTTSPLTQSEVLCTLGSPMLAAPVVNSYTVPGSSITISSTTMNSSELAELQQKLQESLRLQGLPGNPTACVVSNQSHSTILPTIVPSSKTPVPRGSVQINGSVPDTRPLSGKGRRKGTTSENKDSGSIPDSRHSNTRNSNKRGNAQFPRVSNNQMSN